MKNNKKIILTLLLTSIIISNKSSSKDTDSLDITPLIAGTSLTGIGIGSVVVKNKLKEKIRKKNKSQE